MTTRAYVIGRLQGDRLIFVIVSNSEPWNFTVVGPESTWIQIGPAYEGRTVNEARQKARDSLDTAFYRHLKPLLKE